MLKIARFSPPYGGSLTFYYASNGMNRFFPHVHCALNGFENGPNFVENSIESSESITSDTHTSGAQ